MGGLVPPAWGKDGHATGTPEGISPRQGDPTMGLRGLAGALAVLVAVVGTRGPGPASPRYSHQHMPG